MNAVIEKIISFLMSAFLVFPYIGSFMSKNINENFAISEGAFAENSVMLNGLQCNTEITGDCEFANGKLILKNQASIAFSGGECSFFNYFALSYNTDAYLKGNIKYKSFNNVISEDFFLRPDENEFYSFIDGYLSGKKAKKIVSVSFTVLDKENAELQICGISTFNRKIEDEIIYCENEFAKFGLSLKWGGALSYFEDLDSNVQVVKKDGEIRVDSNASDRYGVRSVNNKVNLVNCYDAGRLVQQSYYGAWDYTDESGEYMNSKWNYNPVQGGNKYNDSSKIVDLKFSENSVYVKCRPLDWSLEKEYITPSYMEATYTLEGEKLFVSCAFTDYSGYPPTTTTQEMPAFYCVEPLDHFYYCDNGEVKCKDDLIFWPDAGYPFFQSNENWVAFTGEFDDSFGIGLYVPGGTNFLAGIADRGQTESKNPATDRATSYVALVNTLEFKSFNTISYDYCITTGTVNEIRAAFNAID